MILYSLLLLGRPQPPGYSARRTTVYDLLWFKMNSELILFLICRHMTYIPTIISMKMKMCMCHVATFHL